MRIGCCTSLNNIELVEQTGFDYVELTVIDTLIPEESELEFDKIKKKIDSAPLKSEVFNVFQPAELKITGDTVDFARLTRYVGTAYRRAKSIGGEILVFGGGAARTVPAGFPRDKAELQLLNFLKMAADCAAKNGVIIAIEPLNRNECNIINSIPEAVDFAKQVNHPAIKVIADLFHVTQENEPIEHLAMAKQYLIHLHIAEPGQRLPPGTTNSYNYTPFFKSLKTIGYENRISIECKWTSFATEITPALNFLKSLIQT